MLDNYDLWERNERKMEDKLEKCPKCALCGEPIQDEYGYRLDDQLYCWDCAIEWLRDVAAEPIELDEEGVW